LSGYMTLLLHFAHLILLNLLNHDGLDYPMIA